MTPAEKEYKDIINMSWRDEAIKYNHAFFRKHPPMTPENRAKIFAPFAALRGHSDRLAEETGKLMRTRRAELSEEEAAALSDKLMQVTKGMKITVVYFEPDSESGTMGYCISLSGKVNVIDPVYRVLKIATGQTNDKGAVVETVRFDDLLDVSGPEIVGLD